tara:strand:- start:25719 stop:26141 length:423 start_codon:yes stop_codon:yes gene_type:complete
MPLYNWIKCNDEKIQYTRKGKKGNKYHDLINWELLYNEYLKEFGLDKRYKKYLETKTEKALLQSEYIITKERFKLTEIEIQNQKLKDLEIYFGEGKSIEVILTWMGKFLGYKLNQKTTTVKEYFVILEEYGKANKKVGNS